MSSNVISKSKVVVQDDFFNEIVDGFKSPVEEKIETQDAKNSRVQLGGKQLALFKSKVVPIFGKEIEKNKMVQDYMQHVSDSYEQQKINQMREEYVEALKVFTGIEREAEDEIDEIQRDEKGQQIFLFKGLQLFKTIRRIMSFYNMIEQMKAQIQSSDETNKNTIHDYNLENQDQRRALYNELNEELHRQGIRFVPAMQPILTKVTQSIFDISYKAFEKINTAIYIEIAKMLAQIALEYGAAKLLTVMTGGGAAGTFGAVARSIAYNSMRVQKLLGVGAKYLHILPKMGALGRGVGRGTATVARGMGQGMREGVRRMGKYTLENPREALRNFRLLVKGYEVIDILYVDQGDLDEVKNWATATIAPYRHQVEAQWEVVSRDINTSLSMIEAFDQLTAKVSQEIYNKIFRVSSNLEQKYNSEINIENLNFDFYTFERVTDFFDAVVNSNYQMQLDQFLIVEGGKIKFGRNSSFEFNTIGDYLRWKITDIDNEINTLYISAEMLQKIKEMDVTGKWYTLSRDEIRYPVRVDKEEELTSIDIEVGGFTTTVNSTISSSSIEYHTLRSHETDRYIRLKEEVANKGVEFRFAKFGVVSGVRFYFQFNPSYFSEYIKNKPLPNIWINSISFMETIRGFITTMTEDDKIYLYKDGKKVESIDGINVINNRDYIDIDGFNSDIKKYNITKRVFRDIVEVIQTEDFHEIGDFHNTLLVQEIEYGKKLEIFKKAIEEELTGMYSLRQSVIKAINDEDTRMRQIIGSSENYGSVYITTYQYFDFKNQQELLNSVSRMTRDELNAIINSQDRDQMRDILGRYGIRVMTVRKETKLPNIVR